ncbi:MAG: class I SAM-dependent methyltransferase [Candidatus Bathyarchaeota archaeon]|nr:class I SAM-dependent methyltransferase [Candidatus Bathyarchaeota archaeon]
MNSANKKAFFKELVFEVYNDVYEPAEDSFLFADNLHVRTGTRVLDIGTGSGILGILAAKKALKVIAVDINPHAVRCAAKNAKQNYASDKLFFLQGDLFAPIAETAKFDLILFNSPYLPSEEGEDEHWLGRAWAGGVTGRQVIDRFIKQAPPYLKREGEILLMQSNLAGIEETVKAFQNQKMQVKPFTYLNLPFFEKLALLKATF